MQTPSSDDLKIGLAFGMGNIIIPLAEPRVVMPTLLKYTKLIRL